MLCFALLCYALLRVASDAAGTLFRRNKRGVVPEAGPQPGEQDEHVVRDATDEDASEDDAGDVGLLQEESAHGDCERDDDAGLEEVQDNEDTVVNPMELAEPAPATPQADTGLHTIEEMGMPVETAAPAEHAAAMSAEERHRRAVMERCLALRLVYGRGPR